MRSSVHYAVDWRKSNIEFDVPLRQILTKCIPTLSRLTEYSVLNKNKIASGAEIFSHYTDRDLCVGVLHSD